MPKPNEEEKSPAAKPAEAAGRDGSTNCCDRFPTAPRRRLMQTAPIPSNGRYSIC